MSQFIDEASRISGFTTTHAYVGGTDRFMCPELLEDQPKTPATDIWALGCLVAQILTDVIPYQDITRKQAVPVAILKGDPPMVNMDGAIAESLWNCIKECWSKTPNDRPDTSEIKRHVIAAMDPIVEGPNCSGDINEPALHSQSSDFGPSIKYLESIRTWKANPHIPVSEVKGCLERLVCSTVLTDESFSWKSDSRVSPDGEFFAVVNQAGSISISRTNGIQVEPIKTWTIGQLPPWLTRPLVTWSATQRHLLIYSWHSLLSEPAFQKVFSLETGTLLLDTDSEFAKFTHDGSAIVFLRHVNKSCIQLTYQELVAGIPLISSKLIPEGTDDACDMFTNTDNRYTTIITASQYIVYDWRDDEIERMTYMNPSYFRAICAVSISQDGRFFLRTLPAEKPTLWRISTPGSPNSRPDPSIVTSYIAPNSSGRIVYYLGVQFGGLGDQLVVAHIQQAQYNGADFCIWDRDTSALLHSLSMSDRFHYCRAQFIWNSIIPGDIKLVLQRSTRPEGRGPSMVQIWSCSSQH
ncbi:hypothetical protein FRC03_005587 [Tulasnella sp. 419]|nr:hypothetical protein FRC03_005587 [Tulasnella sp. 419]